MIEIRKLLADEGPVLLSLIEALAAYESLDPPAPDAQARLVRDLFCERPRVEAFLALVGGIPVGYTFIFETYSTLLALPTLFLEDLFVLPAYRKQKVGSALFRAMVREAHARGCGRMEWQVLDWNQLAIDVYQHYGAKHMRQWQTYRLVREDLQHILNDT